MNFYDLSAKLRAIEESSVAECGDMMPMPMMPHAPGQQDSVTMNVSMNGNGAGGIKDLMDILRNIEQAAEHDHDHQEPMVAEPHHADHDVDIVLGTADEDMLADPNKQQGGSGAGDESYGNSAPGGSDAHQFGIDSVTRHGDDMHSKGSVKRLRVNGGENPLQEALVERLTAMYQEIKEGGASEKEMDAIRKKYNKYDESAKYRDPKYKDKLYTQDPNFDDEDDFYNDTNYYGKGRPENDPGKKHKIGGGEFDHNDPLRKGYGRHGTGSMNTHGKRKGMPSRDQISSLKGSIKAAHGTHPRPNLPE